MRFSELGSKEIVNLYDGERVGLLGETDLSVDEVTGAIREILVPGRHGFWRSQRPLTLEWSAIRRIGPEIVIVDVEPEGLGLKKPRS